MAVFDTQAAGDFIGIVHRHRAAFGVVIDRFGRTWILQRKAMILDSGTVHSRAEVPIPKSTIDATIAAFPGCMTELGKITDRKLEFP